MVMGPEIVEQDKHERAENIQRQGGSVLGEGPMLTTLKYVEIRWTCFICQSEKYKTTEQEWDLQI